MTKVDTVSLSEIHAAQATYQAERHALAILQKRVEVFSESLDWEGDFDAAFDAEWNYLDSIGYRERRDATDAAEDHLLTLCRTYSRAIAARYTREVNTAFDGADKMPRIRARIIDLCMKL